MMLLLFLIFFIDAEFVRIMRFEISWNGQFRDRELLEDFDVLEGKPEFKASEYNCNYKSTGCSISFDNKVVNMVATQLAGLFSRLQIISTSDHASVVSMNIFVALLCACIVIGHLLEENRWMNESITALVIVSFSVDIFLRGFTLLWNIQLSFFFLEYMFHMSGIFDFIYIGRVFVLGLLFCWRVEEKAHIF